MLSYTKLQALYALYYLKVFQFLPPDSTMAPPQFNMLSYSWLPFTASLLLFMLTAIAQTDNYIVYMDQSAMPKAFSTKYNWHLATLSSVFAAAKSKNSAEAAAASSSMLLYSYTHVINGFSARLSASELETLKKFPGYISCIKDVPVELDTTRSTSFIGLNLNSEAWKVSNYGEGIIIGVVDTGIWPESESYDDKGIFEIPKRWKGECENGTQFNSSLCNKKLIGARAFNKAILASDPNITIAMNSARDTLGHGTHVSSTAAGNFVEGASFFGYARGTASGTAPKSHLAIYKAQWLEGSFMSDVIAAIDQAIIDGVDVLSLSLSYRGLALYEDPIAMATFAAVEKNIFVSASAGNRGPSRAIVANGTPWLLTVASGTVDREFKGVLTLGNGVAITGVALYPGNFTSRQIPVVFSRGDCSTMQEIIDVGQKIVVCIEGENSLDSQVSTVGATEAIGAIFITDSIELESYIPTSFPAIFLNSKDGETLKNYINSSASPLASMKCNMTVVGMREAPSLAGYSSRGPSRSCPPVLKPDIMAPGSLILAAWPDNRFVTLVNHREVFNKFNLLSGTSMACPHAAGVAALVKKAHPDWSSAAIRSAIMTTADSMDNRNKPIKDIGLFNRPATPLDMGAGQINPNKALEPGLIYDLNSTDYVNLLCALNFTQTQIRTITKSPINDCSSPSLDLNYPAFLAYFNAIDPAPNSTTVLEFHRTVTNVGDPVSTYSANLTAINGLKLNVIPKELKFKAKNEKLSYKLIIEGPSLMEEFIVFGYLNWVDSKDKHNVKSPVVATSLNFELIE